MGTNYYFVKDHCEHCMRGEEYHIGKSSLGWTFHFHSPFIVKMGNYGRIESYKEWLKLFKECKGYIKNEYGEVVQLKEFKKLIKSKKNEKNNHAIEYASESKGCFLDKDGNSFSNYEFS